MIPAHHRRSDHRRDHREAGALHHRQAVRATLSPSQAAAFVRSSGSGGCRPLLARLPWAGQARLRGLFSRKAGARSRSECSDAWVEVKPRATGGISGYRLGEGSNWRCPAPSGQHAGALPDLGRHRWLRWAGSPSAASRYRCVRVTVQGSSCRSRSATSFGRLPVSARSISPRPSRAILARCRQPDIAQREDVVAVRFVSAHSTHANRGGTDLQIPPRSPVI